MIKREAWNRRKSKVGNLKDNEGRGEGKESRDIKTVMWVAGKRPVCDGRRRGDGPELASVTTDVASSRA